MALKSLKISGFKSFADPVTVEFDQEITGIIGPNGSGKSNLTEALRWVMGEQSPKSLRGGKMEDIIFAGSEKRAPLDRAEVILKFDNHNRQLNIETDEVEIRRRLFRGGESECLLNNKKVRLKDIVDLFLDSGLGRDSFSIISQGNVERIFNSKPSDRRFIIEEPAGVSGFKLKKHQAQQQLQQTDNNLQRINDIVQELDHQITPLKHQAQVAQSYQKHKREADELKQLILAFEIKQLNEQKEKWSIKQQATNKHLAVIERRLAAAKTKANNQQTLDQQLTSEIDHKQQQITNFSRQLESLRGQQALVQERLNFNAANCANLKQQKKANQQKYQKFQNDFQQQRQNERHLNQQLQQLQAQIAKLQTAVPQDRQTLDQKITQLQAHYIAMVQQQTALYNQEKYLKQQNSQIKQQLQETNTQLLTQNQQLKKTETHRQDLIQQYQQLQHTQKSLLVNKKATEQKYQQLQVRYDSKRRHYNQKLQHWQQQRTELTSLNKIVQQHQGYYQGVRVILKQKEALPGIIGAVAELITVPPRLQVALQAAVGSQLQAIVTQNQTAARKAITFLRQQKAGRATFLPLNVMKSRKIAAANLQGLNTQKYFIGIASDLINYDPCLTAVMENVFGRLLIVTDIEAAIGAGKLIRHRFLIVTLKGDLINPGGSMTGGQIKNGLNLLAQKNQVRSLEQEVQQAQLKLQQQRQDMQHQQEQIAQTSELLARYQRQLRPLAQRLQKIKSDLLLDQQQQTNQQQQVKDSSTKVEQLKLQLDQIQQQQVTVKQKIQTLTTQITQQQQEIDQKQVLIKDFAAQKQGVEERLQQQQTKLVVVQNDLHNQRQQQHQLQNEIQDLQEQKVQLDKQQQKLEQERKDLTASSQDQDQQIALQVQQLQSLESKLQKNKTTRQQLSQQIQQVQQQVTALFALQKKWTAAQENNVVQVTTITNQIKQKLTVLEQQYRISFEAAYQKISPNWSLDQAQQRAHLLQQQITALGPINLNSITDYAQLQKRYKFLTQQQDDLIQARQQLQKTITEMDQEVAQRFAKMFKQVAHAFAEIFPQMFGGGHAQLILDNPQDILTTGIEIIAQPPGKKLQRLSLLSGGERALTAITLLFSVLKVHPVAFCILDEVEASLDDANVSRFADYLKKFDQKTQFIVITHRKGTMMHANRLYGITMQESGVSLIISVQLK